MTGDHDGFPRRRKQAQVLDDKPGRSGAGSPEPAGRPVVTASANPDKSEIRVEDLGNGRARLSVELPWPLALKVLDLLKDDGERREH